MYLPSVLQGWSLYGDDETDMTEYLDIWRRAFSPVNIQMDPPQIATEGFASDSLSERSPNQHTKNRGKSRRANIIFLGKIQNGSQKQNFVY